MKALIAWLFRCRHTRRNFWVEMSTDKSHWRCLDCDAVKDGNGKWFYEKSEEIVMTSKSECQKCKIAPNAMFEVDDRGNCIYCGRSITANAAVANEDPEGVYTVQECVESIIKGGVRAGFNEAEGFVPPSRVGPLGFTPLWGEVSYVKDGKRYNVETLVTVEDLPNPEDVAMQDGYNAVRIPAYYWTKALEGHPWTIDRWRVKQRLPGEWVGEWDSGKIPFQIGERINEPN